MEGNCVEYVNSSTRIRRTRAENGKESRGAREKSGEVGGGRVQDEVLCGCYLGRLLGSLEYPDRSSSTVYFIQLITITLLAVHPTGRCSPSDFGSSTSTLTGISESSTTCLRATGGTIQAPVLLPSTYQSAVANSASASGTIRRIQTVPMLHKCVELNPYSTRRPATTRWMWDDRGLDLGVLDSWGLSTLYLRGNR